MGEKGENICENIEWNYKILCLKGQAEDEYYKNIIKETLRLKNELGKGLYAKEYKELQELRQQVAEKRNGENKPLVFVSLRPPKEDVWNPRTFSIFKKAVDKILTKKWMTR